MALNETQLIQEVGVWADKNFGDKRGADLGICEEIGEAIHCVLKHRQGIRGFDNREFFLEQFTDCLCDILIYLCDYCYLRNAFFKLERNQMNIHGITIEDERRVIVHLLQGAASVMSFPEVYVGGKIAAAEAGTYTMFAQRICTGVECWAHIYSIDTRLALAATWAKVSKRDWVAQPKTAGN